MATVPYTFANTPGGASIPLAKLDANFAAIANPGLLSADVVTYPAPAGKVSLQSLPVSTSYNISVGGYYNNGDGGGGFFYGITGKPAGTYTTNNGTIFVPVGGDGSSAWVRIVEQSTTLKMWGAVGDDSTDDTTAIQNAINCIKYITVTPGTYKITQTITIIGSTNISLPGTSLIFEEGSTIKKYGHGTGGSPYDAVFYIQRPDLINDNTNVWLQGRFSLLNVGGDFGVIYDPGGNHRIDGAAISANVCVRAAGSLYQSTFRDLFLNGALKGFSMGDTGTSNTLDNIYVVSSTVYAYELRGSYSFGFNLAADYCSGVAYYIVFGDWAFGSVGSESPGAVQLTNFIRVENGYASFDEVYYSGPSPASASIVVFYASVGSLNINSGIILSSYSSAPNVMAGHLYGVGGSAKVNLGNTLSIYDNWQTFDAVNNLAVTSSMTISAPATYNNASSTSLSNPYMLRDGGQVISGINYSLNGSNYLDPYHITPYMQATSFVHNVGSNPLTRSDGVNVQYNRGGAVGDIWLTKNPSAVRGLGWIMISTADNTVGGGTYRKIPYIDWGLTASRPTVNLYPGQQFFDATLGIPIWWSGGGWVKADGTAV